MDFLSNASDTGTVQSCPKCGKHVLISVNHTEPSAKCACGEVFAINETTRIQNERLNALFGQSIDQAK